MNGLRFYVESFYDAFACRDLIEIVVHTYYDVCFDESIHWVSVQGFLIEFLLNIPESSS